ncbi:MAG: SPFH domain-containing protein [Planctomycetota bacterium]
MTDMKRLTTALLAIFIALVFLTYMVTYTVRYDQVAILTTFEQASEPDGATIAQGKNSGSVIQEAGLYFKWPWPIQRVETYPTRLQVLQDQPEEIRLADGNTVIVNMAVTWRIENPLEFFRALESVDNANRQLRPQMSDLRKVLSGYRFDQFVNENPEEVKLEEIEAEIAEQFRQQLAGLKYGIAIEQITMGKLLYNGSTATKVNERMTATQNRLAEEIRSQGNSEATTIRTDATSASKQIREFASTAAEDIRAIGKSESAQIIGQLAATQSDQEFAAFLRGLEAAEVILANKSIFIIDGSQTPPFDTFLFGPDDDLSRPNEEPTRYRPSPLRPGVDSAQSGAAPLPTGARP